MGWIKTIFFLMSVVFVLSSCSNGEQSAASSTGTSGLENVQTTLDLEDYNHWILDEDNGLVKNKKLSEIEYTLSFLPTDVLVQREGKMIGGEKELLEMKSHYENMTYFNFRIAVPEAGAEPLKYKLSSAIEYEERIKYMAFQMKNDIRIVQGSDTLNPGLYHFERAFNVVPFVNVMFAFDNDKFSPAEEFTVVINDNLFNKGELKYNFQENQLIDLPKISAL
jgi:hypothetical protein